ncbi:MAG: biotin--[acetyl-CoA-carboxylase] ligase [Planctomycetota bacterium]
MTPSEPWSPPSWLTYHEHRHQTASTNSDALEWLRCSAVVPSTPALFTCDLQTAGRGRLDRRWVDQEGNLAFTLVVQDGHWSRACRDCLALLPPVVTLEACQLYVSRFEQRSVASSMSIKWPNDVCLEQRKVSGVLVERLAKHPDLVAIGVGINVSRSPSLEDREVGCLAEAVSLSKAEQLERWSFLSDWLALWWHHADSPGALPGWLEAFRRHDLLQGKLVSLRWNGRLVEGRSIGVSDSGDLRLLVDGVVEEFRGGEVERVRIDE